MKIVLVIPTLVRVAAEVEDEALLALLSLSHALFLSLSAVLSSRPLTEVLLAVSSAVVAWLADVRGAANS